MLCTYKELGQSGGNCVIPRVVPIGQSLKVIRRWTGSTGQDSGIYDGPEPAKV